LVLFFFPLFAERKDGDYCGIFKRDINKEKVIFSNDTKQIFDQYFWFYQNFSPPNMYKLTFGSTLRDKLIKIELVVPINLLG